jgi:hypothetical protein
MCDMKGFFQRIKKPILSVFRLIMARDILHQDHLGIEQIVARCIRQPVFDDDR